MTKRSWSISFNIDDLIENVLKADEEGRLCLPRESLDKDSILEELQRIRANRKFSRCKKVFIVLDRLETFVNKRKKKVSVRVLEDQISKMYWDSEVAQGKYVYYVLDQFKDWLETESRK